MNENLRIGKTLGATAIARAIAALGSVLFLVVIGRLYGASATGNFAIFQALVLIGATFSCLGSNNAIIKYAAFESGGDLRALQYLKLALRNVLLVCLICSALFYLIHGLVEISVFPKFSGVEVVLLVFSVCGFSFSLLLSGILRGVGKPVSASLIDNGVSSLLAAGLVVIISRSNIDIGFTGILVSYCVAVWLSALQGVIYVGNWVKRLTPKNAASENLTALQRKEFYATSRHLLSHGMASLFYSSFSIVIASHYLANDEIGYLKAAQQLCELIGFSLIVVNAIYPAKFAYLFHRGEYGKLKRAATTSCIIAALAAMPFFLAFLTYPETILSIYGDGFSQATFVLQVLALAQLINVLTGPSGFMLAMTGCEKELRNIAVFYGLLGSILIFFLSAFGELPEVAVGLSAMVILQNVTSYLFVKQKLGFYMIGMGR